MIGLESGKPYLVASGDLGRDKCVEGGVDSAGASTED